MNVLSLITCTVTGMGYVGVARNADSHPKKDFNPNKYGHGTKFREALAKYGRECFTIRILGHGYEDRESLHRAERDAVIEHGTLWPNGYNVRPGGNGPDVSHGSEHARLIREAQARPDVKSKMRIANKEIANRPDVKAKKAAATKRAWQCPEYKKRTSQSLKKAWADHPEAVEKHRKAVSDAIKRWWADPLVRERQVASLRKRNQRPEYRAKQRAAMRSNNRLVTHDGETHSIADWARLVGITYGRLHSRIERGWPIELALNPNGKRRHRKPQPPPRTYAMVTFSCRKCSAEFSIIEYSSQRYCQPRCRKAAAKAAFYARHRDAISANRRKGAGRHR